MPDPADLAQPAVDGHNEYAISLVPRPVGRSAHFCMDCDARIPQERRDAYPGTQRCVECQEDIDRLNPRKKLRRG